MSTRRFLIILALVAAFAVCIPFDSKVTPLMVKGITTSAPFAMVGDSVITHASRCESDQRSIPRMLADEIGQRVLDLSFPGQSLDESVSLAMTALRNPRLRTVVFPVSATALQEWDTDAIRNYALARLIGPNLRLTGLAERAASPDRFSGAPFHEDAEFDYDGKHYPGYDGIKASYFDNEMALMRCPENDGADLKFVAAIYYHAYPEYPMLQDNVTLLSSLGAEAARLQKSLVIVVLPINYELMERLAVRDVAVLPERTAAVVAAFQAGGLNVLDLSAIASDSDFADRWCGCGHMLSAGRSKVANQIAHGLPHAVRAIAAH